MSIIDKLNNELFRARREYVKANNNLHNFKCTIYMTKKAFFMLGGCIKLETRSRGQSKSIADGEFEGWPIYIVRNENHPQLFIGVHNDY